MIRLTRQADYGILLLSHVAAGPEGAVHAAPELASETGVPVPMVSKILKRLARGGLLVSSRGAHGGYRLARAPEDISMADIVVAIEGGISMTSCSEGGDSSCRLESRCRVHANWRKLNKVVVGALARVSLAEMAQPLPDALVTLDFTQAR